jgi:hypothetical protein
VKAQWHSKTAGITLKPKTDLYCYNVQLQTPHQSAPSVGFSIISMTTRMQPQYYLQLRVRMGELSQQMVPISLRIPHLINEWKMLGFNVIVSSRNDIELNTYRLETLSLTGCSNATNQGYSIDVESDYSGTVSTPVKIFLNGWELATKEDSELSSFEVTVTDFFLTSRTLYFTVSRTTRTELYAVYISYFIIGKTISYDSKTEVIQSIEKMSVGVDCTKFTELRIVGLSSFVFHMTFEEIINVHVELSDTGISFTTKSQDAFSTASISYIVLGREVSQEQVL